MAQRIDPDPRHATKVRVDVKVDHPDTGLPALKQHLIEDVRLDDDGTIWLKATDLAYCLQDISDRVTLLALVPDTPKDEVIEQHPC